MVSKFPFVECVVVRIENLNDRCATFDLIRYFKLVAK